MTRRWGVTIDCADPARLASFWREALQYGSGDQPPDDGPGPDVPEPERNAWAAVGHPEGAGPGLFFQRVPEGKVAKNRLHLDIEVGGTGDYDARRKAIEGERARLLALGASDHRGAEDRPPMYWVRMNDPEGNEFCLV